MENLKRVLPYKFPSPNISLLLELIAIAKKRGMGDFRKRYGRILTYVYQPSAYETSGIYTLLQFYDAELRCFVFPDFVLAPTLEEYSALLDIPIREQMPFYRTDAEPKLAELSAILCLKESELSGKMIRRGDVWGFPLDVLVEKAREYAQKGSWDVFDVILAVCVYGIVLFPNIPDFVDSDAFYILAAGNPVPTLLGDIHHSTHYQNEKRRGRNVSCCVPLLCRWFTSHMPKSGPFVTSINSLGWPERLMGLTAENVVWTNKEVFGVEVILKGEGFPNVPLIGRKGCVNYNPSLLIKQFGYIPQGAPKPEEIQESLYLTGAIGKEMLTKLEKAWKNLHKRGKLSGSRGDTRVPSPYVEWIRERAVKFLMPYPAVQPLHPPPVEEPTTVDMQVYKQLMAEKEELARAKEALEQENAQLRHEQIETGYISKQQDETLKHLKTTLLELTETKKRLELDVDSVSSVLATKKQELERAYTKLAKFREHWDRTMTKRKEREEELKTQIAQLEEQVKVKNEELEEEACRRYEAERKLTDAMKNLEDFQHRADAKRPKPGGGANDKAWEDFVRDIQGTVRKRDRLIEGLIYQPDHAETKKMVEDFRNRTRI